MQDEFRKHLNIDFDEEQLDSQDEVGSITSDTKMPIVGYRESMRDSLPQSRMPANSLM